MTIMQILSFGLLGLATGLASGMVGIGGGLIIVPILTLVFMMPQKMAQGISIMMFVFPVGLAAAYNYWKAGNTNFQISIILAIFYVIGSFISSGFTQKLDDKLLKNVFAIFMFIAAFNMLDLKYIIELFTKK